MPKYEYEAVNPTSRTRHKGVIEAPTMEAALQKLVSRKIFPSYFSEMTATQVAVATRISNFKKLARPMQQDPGIPLEDLVAPPPKKWFDWSYVVIIVMVLTLAAWALSR